MAKTPRMSSKTPVPTFDEVKAHAQRMEDNLGGRTELYGHFEKIYAMEWEQPPTDKYVKQTMSAQPHNAINSAARLLCTAEPSYSMDPVEDSQASRDEASKVGKTIKEMVERSNRQQNAELEREVVSSLGIFGEAVVKTADLRPARVFQGNKQGFKNIPTKITPIVFKVLHPNTFFYEQADYGLSAVVEKRDRTIGDIKRSWGALAQALTGAENTPVTFYEYWDYNPFDQSGIRCVWVSGLADPLIPPMAHGMSFLPYSMRMSHSLSFLSDEKYRHSSMLFPLYKGNIWARTNLMLTILATNLTLFVNPKWVSKTKDGRKVSADLNEPGGVLSLYTDESIDPLARDLVPKELYDLLGMLQQATEDATLPRVVAGANSGGSRSGYSFNLLTQQGRLAIFPMELAANMILEDSVDAALGWIADGKFPLILAPDMQITADLATKYVDRAHVELKASMPNDKVQLGNLWNRIIAGGWGDPRTAWAEMGFDNPSDMMDRLLEWVFIKQDVQDFMKEKAAEFGLQPPTPQPQTGPGAGTPAETGQPPAPPPGAPPAAIEQLLNQTATPQGQGGGPSPAGMTQVVQGGGQ